MKHNNIYDSIKKGSMVMSAIAASKLGGTASTYGGKGHSGGHSY